MQIYERIATLFCLYIYSAILEQRKTVEASSDSCPVSRTTVKAAPRCPVTEEEWRKAEEMKNCSRYADHCDEPDKFMYHCVLSPYLNETLELCAYAQNIIGGSCTVYSLTGNLIQPSYKAPCGNFTSKPCPNFYRSNEGFKYPECYMYKQVKRSNHDTDHIYPSRIPKTTILKSNTTSSKNEVYNTTSSNEKGKPAIMDDSYRTTDSHIFLPIIIIIVVIVIMCVVFYCCWRKLHVQSRGKRNEHIILKQKQNANHADIEKQERQELIELVNSNLERIALFSDLENTVLDAKYEDPSFLLNESNGNIIMQLDYLSSF